MGHCSAIYSRKNEIKCQTQMKKEMLLQTFYCKHFFNKIAVQIERRLSKPKTSLLISSKLHMQFQWLHKMFVFTAWHKIKKFSCQKFIHASLSRAIQPPRIFKKKYRRGCNIGNLGKAPFEVTGCLCLK